jgi:hypothetical protein
MQAPSTPSLGTSLHGTAPLQPHTDPSSPVIIAEHMIGCAMYELVCEVRAIAGASC